MSASDFFVRFWGVRGSIPTPGPRTRRYGGNTSCVEVRAGKTLLVFDAGTGLRELGVHLARNTDAPITVHLFLSHPHWDHIQGFPFFGPAYQSSTTINVYGPKGDDKHYQLLSGQMSNAYFPVRFSDLGARILARSFKGDSVDAGDATVHLFNQQHPGGSLGFRVVYGKKSVVFSTDNELDQLLADKQRAIEKPDELRKLPKELLEPVRNADLLIADAQYTDDDYSTKVGWGHPRAHTVVDLAGQAGVKRLALTHHDPMHSDREIDVKVSEAELRARRLGFEDLEIFGAREGVTLRI
ncbi:MAG: MBL fold metallo-hydrolase [Myxococcota bacterium]